MTCCGLPHNFPRVYLWLVTNKRVRKLWTVRRFSQPLCVCYGQVTRIQTFQVYHDMLRVCTKSCCVVIEFGNDAETSPQLLRNKCYKKVCVMEFEPKHTVKRLHCPYVCVSLSFIAADTEYLCYICICICVAVYLHFITMYAMVTQRLLTLIGRRHVSRPVHIVSLVLSIVINVVHLRRLLKENGLHLSVMLSVCLPCFICWILRQLSGRLLTVVILHVCLLVFACVCVLCLINGISGQHSGLSFN